MLLCLREFFIFFRFVRSSLEEKKGFVLCTLVSHNLRIPLLLCCNDWFWRVKLQLAFGSGTAWTLIHQVKVNQRLMMTEGHYKEQIVSSQFVDSLDVRSPTLEIYEMGWYSYAKQYLCLCTLKQILDIRWSFSSVDLNNLIRGNTHFRSKTNCKASRWLGLQYSGSGRGPKQVIRVI